MIAGMRDNRHYVKLDGQLRVHQVQQCPDLLLIVNRQIGDGYQAITASLLGVCRSWRFGVIVQLETNWRNIRAQEGGKGQREVHFSKWYLFALARYSAIWESAKFQFRVQISGHYPDKVLIFIEEPLKRVLQWLAWYSDQAKPRNTRSPQKKFLKNFRYCGEVSG